MAYKGVVFTRYSEQKKKQIFSCFQPINLAPMIESSKPDSYASHDTINQSTNKIM
uniref:Uncharacterized protein n=1 Tax=Oryza brachyantha TaxID=4533 RepID=J3LK83_ORYBR